MADAEVRQRRNPEAPVAKPPTPPTSGESDDTALAFHWTSPSTWPTSLRLFPIPLLLLGAFLAIYWTHFTAESGVDLTTYDTCRQTFNFTFRVNAARAQAEDLAAHSWEYGTAAQAVTELVNPEKAVFAPDPFPNDKIPVQGFKMDQALIWVYQHIRADGPTLSVDDGGSVSDPASLGVSAVMVGQRWKTYLAAAERQKEFLLQDAPRYVNGAISHRRDVAELWSDGVAMFPPFLAYYAVQTNDLALMRAAVQQIKLYRDALRIESGEREGLWRHIVGPSERADDGAWSTGNAWAAHGMARVRATISGWRPSREVMKDEIGKLDRWIREILDGAMRTDTHESGLLRNYLGQDSWFAETSSTALLAATTYRMALLHPATFAQPPYLDWAHAKRAAVASRVDDNGFAHPAVNPLQHASRQPVLASPEGASFLLMMGSAWRDCVCRGVCAVEVEG
ncbi:hypothetical protein LTR53_016046 [Teratosphaeriaceae sp. CCFEE 6253]|nr:hypothetical protein LTR53_016046 [Teratosphaeriaceae sp. CCFEE 6253]